LVCWKESITLWFATKLGGLCLLGTVLQLAMILTICVGRYGGGPEVPRKMIGLHLTQIFFGADGIFLKRIGAVKAIGGGGLFIVFEGVSAAAGGIE